MTSMTHIRRATVADLMAVERQPSQAVQLGLAAEMTPAAADDLTSSGEAWVAVRSADDRPLACYGLRETFPGAQAVAWAILSPDIGAAHLAITRHAQRRIAESPLARIEAIVRVGVAAEVAWAKLVGLAPAHLLRKFGALSEDHLLMERIRG